MTIATLTTVVQADHILGPSQGHWTYAAYAALPADGTRYEILNGVLYMAPAPIPDHENIVMLLGARLVSAIEDTGLGRVFASPDLDLGTLVVRPDAVVVLNASQGIVTPQRLIGPPDIVIEITSPSTAAYDRDAVTGKRGAYAQAGIPEYWIVDPLTRTVEVLVLAVGGYTTLGIAQGDAPIRSRALIGVSIRASACFPR